MLHHRPQLPVKLQPVFQVLYLGFLLRAQGDIGQKRTGFDEYEPACDNYEIRENPEVLPVRHVPFPDLLQIDEEIVGDLRQAYLVDPQFALFDELEKLGERTAVLRQIQFVGHQFLYP